MRCHLWRTVDLGLRDKRRSVIVILAIIGMFCISPVGVTSLALGKANNNNFNLRISTSG